MKKSDEELELYLNYEYSYQEVIDHYIAYLKRNFGDHVTIVFDAYDGESTKVVERNRRLQKFTLKEYQFTKEMLVSVSQENFYQTIKIKADLYHSLWKN